MLGGLVGLGGAARASAAAGEPGDREEADRLVRAGSRAGDEGRLQEAIQLFKRAEARFPRAIHDCNIGLAYARLKSWSQALFFLERCRGRATERLPAWVDSRIEKTLEVVRGGGHAPIEIVTDPPGATVRVSTFASDESFTGPQTIWLPLGSYEIAASLEGHGTVREQVTIDSSRPRSLRLVLASAAAPAPSPPTPPAPASAPGSAASAPAPAPTPPPVEHAAAADLHGRARGHGRWPWITLAAGALVLGAGVYAHLQALDTKDQAEALPPGDPRFRRLSDDFDNERLWTVSLYGVGAIAVGVGLYFLLRPAASETHVARWGASVDQRSALVWVAGSL